jgi:hypothetical protein
MFSTALVKWIRESKYHQHQAQRLKQTKIYVYHFTKTLCKYVEHHLKHLTKIITFNLHYLHARFFDNCFKMECVVKQNVFKKSHAQLEITVIIITTHL